jgi:DNA polymerase III subunit epsilon
MSLDLKLNIRKSLVFLKVATTGFEPIDKKNAKGDRIVEISLIKIGADRKVTSGTTLINPGIPIPESATKVNGITNEMVASAPTFKDKASGLLSFIGDSDLAGFSISNFDLKFLTEEFNRAGIPFTIIGRNIIDLSSIFNQMEKRDFRTAAEKFADKKLTDETISSETANIIAISVLNGMVGQYSNDDRFTTPTAESLHKNFNKNSKSLDVNSNILLNKDGRPIFNFGKYKGLLIADTMLSEGQYYDWCINASDLPGDTKLLISKIVEKAKSSQSQKV